MASFFFMERSLQKLCTNYKTYKEMIILQRFHRNVTTLFTWSII